MAANGAFHGVARNQDLDPALVNRETRPLRYRIHEIIAETGGFIMVALGVIITLLPMMKTAQVSDVLFIFGLALAWYINGKNRAYQFRTPQEKNKNGKIINNGIMFIGNDRVNGAGLWFSNDDLRTHMLVFGSTGSGKTRFLLGLLYQSMMIGSGCMYVDGKGDNTVWWLVYSLCRRLGREDDLLVINYLTGGESTAEGTKSLDRLSNTNNPFAHGTGEQLRSLIVGLMRDSGGDDMWKGRASAMLGGLLRALTFMRDRGEINLDVETIRSYLPLDRIVELASRTDLSLAALGPIKKYLGELPGYTEEDAIMGQIQAKAYEQHGYLTMQLTEVMADMSDTYGHIFAAQLGEVDFKDVVFNRRILFVMLPALEKDPDALSGLGKLVVAGVRSALAPALGNKLEGTKREVIDQKPTNSNVPFLMILDEYGYYSVKGFAVVAAQARSLGVSVIFAGQDYPSFKKGSEEEAASTVANTNIKVCMKLEDPESTFQVMEARGGESEISQTSGHENKGSAFSGYMDQNQTRIEKRKRINLRDLVNQKPGEAHVMFGDELCRCRLFYADPHQVGEARLNKFLMVNTAQKHIIETINGTFDKLEILFKSDSVITDEDKKTASATDEGVKTFFNDLHLAASRKEDLMNSSIIATGMIEIRERLKDIKIEENAGVKIENKQKERDKEISINYENKSKSQASSSDINMPTMPDMPSFDEEETIGILDVMKDDARPNETIKEQAAEITASFEDLLNKAVIGELEKRADGPVSASQRNAAKPVNQLIEIEKMRGATEGEAQKNAKATMDIMSERVIYPKMPTPPKVSENELESRLKSLIKDIDKIK